MICPDLWWKTGVFFFSMPPKGVCGFNFTKANVDDMVAAAKSEAAEKLILDLHVE